MRVPLKMNEQFHNCSEMLLDLGFYGGNGSLERRSLARRKQKREKNTYPCFSSFGSTAQPWGCGQGPATAVCLGWVTQISGPFCLCLHIGGQVLVRMVKSRACRRS